MFELPFWSLNWEEEQERCAFHPITENPIILDFSKCRYLGEVHQMLKKKFGLPDYYGENRDALWDCLSYLWIDGEEVQVELHGFRSMEKGLQYYCCPMLKVFDDVHAETPNVTFTLVS